MTEYTFRFKTKAQLDLAQATGYIEDYPIVRFKVTGQKGHVIDFAVKTEEEYHQLKKEYEESDFVEKLEIYPDFMYFDREEYD